MRLRDACNLQQCARAPSVKLVCVGGQPPRTASARAHAPCSGSSQSLQQLQSLHSLPGVAGQGFALARAGVCVRAACACGLRACGCVRLGALGVRGRVCVRAACMRAGAACVRAGVFALARALAVQLTTATLSATGIRKTCSGRVCRGSSWGFGSGRVGSLKVQVVKVLK